MITFNWQYHPVSLIFIQDVLVGMLICKYMVNKLCNNIYIWLGGGEPKRKQKISTPLIFYGHNGEIGSF